MVSCIVFGGYDVFLFTVLFLNFVFVGDDVFLFKGWFLVLCLAAMMTSCLRDGLLMAVMYVFLLTGWLLCVYVLNANANLCKNNENYQTIYGSTPDYNPETS